MLAVFDLGRTHKKFLLFDQDYNVVEETAVVIPDKKDEDGDGCEDIGAIVRWIKAQWARVCMNPDYDVKALNFSTHGAAFVHLDEKGQAVTPLYDYMKPLPQEIIDRFYELFGGKMAFSGKTGSPALNMLNSGIQLYWLKKAKPDRFTKIVTSLHLPQYGNFLFSGKKHADITSVGCHTGLWNFAKQTYHGWLNHEELATLLPRPEPVNAFDLVPLGQKTIPVGIGMHDSSAALLPFVKMADAPFVLLSSGTWNIALNAFFEGTLKEEEYRKDCLYYLLDIDRKVAASRLFLGHEYDFQVKKLAAYFNKGADHFQSLVPDKTKMEAVLSKWSEGLLFYPETMQGTGPFPALKGPAPDLSLFGCFEDAYYKLMLDLTWLQKKSIELVAGSIKRLYVSGGFINNAVFMELLQAFLPDWQLFIAENRRASSLGAAIALHEVWQHDPLSASVSPVVPFVKQLDLDLSHYSASVNKLDHPAI